MDNDLLYDVARSSVRQAAVAGRRNSIDAQRVWFGFVFVRQLQRSDPYAQSGHFPSMRSERVNDEDWRIQRIWTRGS